MTEIHTQVVSGSNSAFTLRGLPSFTDPGVDAPAHSATVPEPRIDRYPLRGKPLRYERPFR
uniref:Uncharacterized protein n=1 Tax=Candidatus Kentrum sp. LPFa TaxID=2126335 RepID=A0A450WML4_9GAMM|nr:MAG: hypothetical protein BECKLPF1236A_GA0070988_101944 [Candidatus Kentron sp. LPFa]VFK33119.1 MAG: hypothetical protein BECKLPF1236C_GA0070990_101924 [Candidatus Kentron sp. LPFa]